MQDASAHQSQCQRQRGSSGGAAQDQFADVCDVQLIRSQGCESGVTSVPHKKASAHALECAWRNVHAGNANIANISCDAGSGFAAHTGTGMFFFFFFLFFSRKLWRPHQESSGSLRPFRRLPASKFFFLRERAAVPARRQANCLQSPTVLQLRVYEGSRAQRQAAGACRGCEQITQHLLVVRWVAGPLRWAARGASGRGWPSRRTGLPIVASTAIGAPCQRGGGHWRLCSSGIWGRWHRRSHALSDLSDEGQKPICSSCALFLHALIYRRPKPRGPGAKAQSQGDSLP